MFALLRQNTNCLEIVSWKCVSLSTWFQGRYGIVLTCIIAHAIAGVSHLCPRYARHSLQGPSPLSYCMQKYHKKGISNISSNQVKAWLFGEGGQQNKQKVSQLKMIKY